jgi:hypothetical protein
MSIFQKLRQSPLRALGGASPVSTSMNRLALFAFAWLAACDPPSWPTSQDPTIAGPSLAVVLQDRIPLELITDNPCTGEAFIVEGEFHLVITETTSASGNSQFFFHNTAHGEGTGASGARYVFNQADEFKAQQEGNGPIVFQNPISLLLIRQGSSDVPDNFVIKMNLRTTFYPATGESETIRDNEATECRG